MRRFYLVAASGERRALNGENGVYLSQPTGLGMSSAPSVADHENGFFSVTKETTPQQTILGTLIFIGGAQAAYIAYRQLYDWLVINGDGLQIAYIPYGTTQYMRSVSVSSISKGEAENPGWIRCELTLSCYTPWYRPTHVALSMLSISGSSISPMTYPFRYDSTLRYATSVGSNASADINAAGHIASALAIEYSGALVNPVITVKGLATGRVYSRCSINTSIAPNERLEISTRYLDSYVRKVGNVTTDLLPFVNIDEDPLVRIPLGETCRLTMEAVAGLTGSVQVSVYDYYRTV